MKRFILTIIINSLCNLQIYKNHDLEYGFYVRTSVCAVSRWDRKQRLMFALGAKEYSIMYL